jgi:peptidyl-tRNA hydrolase, PTH1 family
MKLIVGLGNPGEKYKETRHNIGFMVLDKVAKVSSFAKASEDKQSFRFEKKLGVEIIKGKIGNTEVILAKPQTFMNLSGQVVSKVTNYYKIKPQDIWIICDDIYLPLGKLRIREKGSSGGHKGLVSIIQELGSNAFIRFRVGIGLPEKVPYEKYVLQKIRVNELKIIKKSIEQTKEAIIFALENSIKEAMDKFSQ